MPAIIDHEQRREKLAEIAAKLVTSGGADAVTVRAVAAKAGFSTKVVSHYFENKRALLLATYRFAAARSSSSAEATQQGGTPCVLDFVQALLPTKPISRENWVVWYAFWAFALKDDEFAREQREQVDNTRIRIAQLIRQDARHKHLSTRQAQRVARELLTEVIGIALQAVFDQTYWTSKRQRDAISARLETY